MSEKVVVLKFRFSKAYFNLKFSVLGCYRREMATSKLGIRSIGVNDL
jgi:hypothetical protein